MKKVTLFYEATDNCTVKSVALSVSSNDPPLPGKPDWIIVNNRQVLLSASCSAGNKEKTYTIIITARDGCGNLATQQVTVSVTHRRTHHNNLYQEKSGIPLVDEQDELDPTVEGLTVKAQPNPAIIFYYHHQKQQ
jgi:hypothetical protein